jgi:hypothetical protein
MRVGVHAGGSSVTSSNLLTLLLSFLTLLLNPVNSQTTTPTPSVSPTYTPQPTPLTFPFCSTLAAGTACTIFGNGVAPSIGNTGDFGFPWNAMLTSPLSLALSPDGLTLAVFDFTKKMLRITNLVTYIVTSLTGGDAGGNVTITPDGPTSTQNIRSCNGLVFNSKSDLFFSDLTSGKAQRIRVANASTGLTTTLAGSMTAFGSSGDNGPAKLALLNEPYGLALDESRALLYFSDSRNHRVRVISLNTGIISHFAGSATNVGGYSGDGFAAIASKMNAPFALALDSSGNLYITDATTSPTVRLVNRTTLIITTIAGTGVVGYSGDGNIATTATLSNPHGIAVDGINGNVYISDKFANTVRIVNGSTSIISTIFGVYGSTANMRDGGPAVLAQLSSPQGIALRSTDGALFVADYSHNRVRIVIGTPFAPSLTPSSTPSPTLTPTPNASPVNFTLCNLVPGRVCTVSPFLMRFCSVFCCHFFSFLSARFRTNPYPHSTPPLPPPPPLSISAGLRHRFSRNKW